MKTIFSFRSFLFLFAVSLLASCSSSRRTIAVEEGWDLLGEAKVNFIRETDVIRVTNRTLYTTVRFKVEDRDVRISSVRVFFDNGDKLEPSLDDVIAAGQSSKYIELGREGRYIDRVEFRYKSIGSMFSKRANVLLYGRKYYQPTY